MSLFNIFKKKKKKPVRKLTVKAGIPGSLGLFGVLGLYFSGRMDDQPELKREVKYFLFLQIVILGLAIISGFLGYSRAETFMSGLSPNNKVFGAVFLSAFIAGMAFILVNHVTAVLAFRALGGRLIRHGAMIGFVASFILCVGAIALDLFISMSGVDPVSRLITEEAYQSKSGEITSTFDKEIQQAEKDVEKYKWDHFSYKGKVWVPTAPTKWHSQDQIDEYNKLVSNLNSLKNSKTELLSTDASKTSSDFKRYNEEINVKVGILTYFLMGLYFIMTLASFRANLYANLVLDYLNSNPYGDIPGDQTDRYGPHQQPINPTPTPSAEPEAILSLIEKVIDQKLGHSSAPVAKDSDHKRPDDDPKIGYQFDPKKGQKDGQTTQIDQTGKTDQSDQKNIGVHLKKDSYKSGLKNPFSKKNRPDKTRGISKHKFDLVVKHAPNVLEEVGHYKVSEISRRTNVSKNTVVSYLTKAMDEGLITDTRLLG